MRKNRLWLVVLFALFFTVPAIADDVTISGNVTFASLDGSSLDHDGTANGTFTVSDGNLVVSGTISCNDDGPGNNSACPMRFAISGNVTIDPGGAIYAENRRGGGTGGDVTITAGGEVRFAAATATRAGAILSTGAGSDRGGNITITAGGAAHFDAGSAVSAASTGGNSGTVSITGGGQITVDGLIASGPGRTLTTARTTGEPLSGGSSNQRGGAITILSSSTSEPGIIIGAQASIVSQGQNGGSSLIRVDGCGLQVYGLIVSVAKGGTSTGVTLRSGTTITVDGRDLGTNTGTRRGLLRADSIGNNSAAAFSVKVLGRTAVQVLGPTIGSLSVLNSNPGGNNAAGGSINVIASEGSIVATGNAIRAGDTNNGDNGGVISIAAKSNVSLDTAALRAIGDNGGKGGTINVRSHSGSVSWQNGIGDVRPTGSATAAANRGTITITYCTTVNTAGSSFPVNGSPTGPFPTLVQSCSPAAPSIPGGETLPTCNRPPVANNDAYTVAEGGTLNVAAPGVLANDVEPDGQPMIASLVSGPTNGTLTLNPNGSFVYVHNGGETTTASFTYKVSDGVLESNVATVTITVTPVNDAPVANNDAYSVAEGGTINLAVPGVKSNDSDPDNTNASLVVELVSNVSHGTLTLNPDGSFLYVHNGTETTSDSFTYRLFDGSAYSNVATVAITIDAVNDAPVANNDAYTVAEGGTLNVAAPGVLANDTDAEGSTLTASIVSGPARGTVTLNVNGSFTYVHNGSETTSDSFTYRANDGSANSNVATVSITVTPVNDAPVANDDSYTVAEGGTLTIPAPGVLGNDTDAENQPLTAIVGPGLAHGTLTLNPNGSFTYVHDGSETTSDSFTYRANDGTANSNVATVSITVTPVNDAPVANDDAYAVAEGGTLNVAAPGVLGNDVDPDNTSLTAQLVSTTSNGTLTFNNDGSFSYVHNGGETTSDSFSYRVNDGTAFSNIATVTIAVTAVNDAPVAGGDSYTVAEGGTLSIAAPGVLGNDSDAENNALTAVLVSGPAHGSLTLNANGSFTYVHDGSETTSDSFTYTANDGTANSNVATVSITITPVNDAPVANNDAYTVAEGGTLTVPAPGVIGNDTDAENQSLSAQFVTNPTHGTLTLNADGSFTYVHNGDEAASDSFTYRVSDGSANSNVATVTITITAVNDAPVANNDAYTVAEGGTLNVAAPGVIGNDVDPDNTTLTATLVSGTTNGTLTLNADGSFSYVHNGSETTTDSFTYTISDGMATSNVATVTITVTPVNDAPVANNDAYSVAEGGTLNVAPPGVLGNDTDADGTFTAVLVTGPANGTLTLNADGSFTYVHNGSETTTDSFTYRANDGTANSNVATVTITITPVNDSPVANPDAYSVQSGATLNVAAPGVLGNDTDAENQALTAILVTAPTKGTLTLNANGSFTYVHNGTTSGTDSFTYKANDGTADSNVTTVTITIINQAPVANDDSFIGVGNTELRVGTGPALYPHALVSGSVLANDVDPDSAIVVTGFDATSANGGTVTMLPNGTFTYLPAVGFTGTDSFNYTVSDGVSSDMGAVLIAVNNRIWYVKNTAAAGDGRSNAPFSTLAQAQSASSAGDTIFVHTGVGPTGPSGITLKPSQSLLGEGVALVSGPYTLWPAGVRPTISNGSGAGISLAANNTVAGLNVAATGNGITAASGASATVSQVGITGGTVGISLASANGAFSFTDVTVAPGQTGLLINGGTPAVTFSNVDITTTGFRGIQGNGGSLTAGTGSTVIATNASAIQLSTMALNATFDTVSSSNSTIGIQLDDTTGSFTANGGVIAVMSTRGGQFTNAGSVTLANMTIRNASQQGVLYQLNTAATGSFTANNTQFLNNVSFAVQAANASTGALALTLNGNTSTSNVGLVVAQTTKGDLNATITNNVATFSRTSPIAISHSTTATGNVVANVSGNTIGTLGVANSGCTGGCEGISLTPRGNGTFTATVTNNTIQRVDTNGIGLAAGQGSIFTKVTATNNTLRDASPGALSAIFFEAGVIGADTNTVCSTITGNVIDASWDSFATIYVAANNVGNTFRLPGYAGGAHDDVAVQNFVSANNGGVPVFATTTGSFNGAACP